MRPAKSIRNTIQSTQRLSEIIAVLIKHGFDNVVYETGIGNIIGYGKNLLGLTKPDEKVVKLPRAVRMRMVLEDLGPTFIKLGQVLSTRPDLIPPSWAEEFKHLQQDCPSEDFEMIEPHLKEIYGKKFDELFEHIEPEALASGSIAQVHVAKLKDGIVNVNGGDNKEIILKIIKPGISEMIEADMNLLNTIAPIVENHFSDLGYSPKQVAKEFARELKREIDLNREGQSTDRLRSYFTDQPDIHFPEVYWKASNKDVLAIEYIKGQSLADLDASEMEPAARTDMLAKSADAIFKQTLEFGYFHADPHAGNIFLMDDGRICFIDCGLTGRIEKRTQELLADLVLSISTGDLELLLDAVIAIGGMDPRIANDRNFRSDVWDFVGRFDVSNLESLEVGSMLSDFFDMLREHGIQCPANMVFLIKTLATAEGVAKQIESDFDFVSHLQPYVKQLVKSRYSIRAMRKRAQRSSVRYLEMAEKLPRELESIADLIKNERLKLNFEHQGIEPLVSAFGYGSRNVASALIIAALMVGSSILTMASAESGWIGWSIKSIGILGFLIALFCVLAMLAINFFQWRK